MDGLQPGPLANVDFGVDGFLTVRGCLREALIFQ